MARARPGEAGPDIEGAAQQTVQTAGESWAADSGTVLFRLLYKNGILPVIPMHPVDKRGSLTNAGAGGLEAYLISLCLHLA